MHRPSTLLIVATTAALAATAAAPLAAADPSGELTAALHAERSAAHCPSVQTDPAVERVAHMASQNNIDYTAFKTAAVPFTDPLPALATIGHPASKAILLSGYGASPAEVQKFIVLSYRALKPDCSFTQYGGSVLQSDDGQYFASVVLATP